MMVLEVVWCRRAPCSRATRVREAMADRLSHAGMFLFFALLISVGSINSNFTLALDRFGLADRSGRTDEVNTPYVWRSKSDYYYPTIEHKMKLLIHGKCGDAFQRIQDYSIRVPEDPNSVFISSMPMFQDMVDWWVSFDRPRQMRVEPLLCDIVYQKRLPIFNNTGCQLPHYMNPSSPRCQTQYLRWICESSRLPVDAVTGPATMGSSIDSESSRASTLKNIDMEELTAHAPSQQVKSAEPPHKQRALTLDTTQQTSHTSQTPRTTAPPPPQQQQRLRERPQQFVLPESHHRESFVPPQPWLVTVREAYVSMCGQLSFNCGFIHTSANCMSTGYLNRAIQFRKACNIRDIQQAFSTNEWAGAQNPKPNITCARGAPFSRSVRHVGRVFVVAEVDDTYVYHIHLEIVPRILYHLDFLMANPDIKILIGCDTKKGEKLTQDGLKKGVAGLKTLLHLALSHPEDSVSPKNVESVSMMRSIPPFFDTLSREDPVQSRQMYNQRSASEWGFSNRKSSDNYGTSPVEHGSSTGEKKGNGFPNRYGYSYAEVERLLDERLVVHEHLYAREVFLPMEGGCQDPVYNTWQILYMRKVFLEKLEIDPYALRSPSPPLLPAPLFAPATRPTRSPGRSAPLSTSFSSSSLSSSSENSIETRRDPSRILADGMVTGSDGDDVTRDADESLASSSDRTITTTASTSTSIPISTSVGASQSTAKDRGYPGSVHEMSPILNLKGIDNNDSRRRGSVRLGRQSATTTAVSAAVATVPTAVGAAEAALEIPNARRGVMMLLKRSSNSKHTRNGHDLVRQWNDRFTDAIMTALKDEFSVIHRTESDQILLNNMRDDMYRKDGYKIVLMSDRNNTLMNCHGCQIMEFSRVDVLIGMHGAGLSNMLYMKPNGAVIELCPYGNDGRCLLGGGPFSRLAAVMSHNYAIHHPGYEEFRWIKRDMSSEFNVTRFVVHIRSFLLSIGFI